MVGKSRQQKRGVLFLRSWLGLDGLDWFSHYRLLALVFPCTVDPLLANVPFVAPGVPFEEETPSPDSMSTFAALVCRFAVDRLGIVELDAARDDSPSSAATILDEVLPALEGRLLLSLRSPLIDTSPL